MIASKKFDLPSAKTLEICQPLYEQGILTYPRYDCEYLPDAHHDEAENVFAVNDDNENSAPLPETSEGENGSCNDINLLEKKTKAPSRFTTAATQAGIIKELVDSSMLIKKGKYLISSPVARSFIHALPENITLHDLTAVWENYFREIIASAQPITVQGSENAKSQKSDGKKSQKKSNVKCPRCGAVMFLRNGKNGLFWGCSNYPKCKNNR